MLLLLKVYIVCMQFLQKEIIKMDNIIPQISVIVPSIGRETLERTLDSIFESTLHSDLLIFSEGA